jgi:hypothetical protein
MEKQDRQVLLSQGFLKGMLVFSAFFALLLVLIILAATFYFPDYVLRQYLSKSRILAKSLSQSIQDVRVFGGENTLKKIVRLNFPQEENIVNIVVRDVKGTMTTRTRPRGNRSRLPKPSPVTIPLSRTSLKHHRQGAGRAAARPNQ